MSFGRQNSGLIMSLLFLLLIIEVITFLAESCFTGRKSDSMIVFWMTLAYQLFENGYLEAEEKVQQQGISHGLVLLPLFKNVLDHLFQVHIPTKKVQYLCCCEEQIYCKCTTGTYLGTHCFLDHILDCNNDS